MSTMSLNIAQLIVGLLCLSLLACQPKNNEQLQQTTVLSRNEVILDERSPKHSYIKEAVIDLIQRPLMEQVTGKITYDETRTVRVSSPIAGRVVGTIAEVGSHVRIGDILTELDSPELGQAQAAYAEALADLNLANHTFQRMRLLYDNDVAPRKQLEQAEDDLIRARSEAERARLRLANLGIRDNPRMDNRFVLHAPLSGVITERNINPGMEIKPDLSEPLFVISDLSRLWVQIDIFEKDIGLIHTGAKVVLNVQAFPSEDFTAIVDYVGQIVYETTRTVKVRCTLSNTDGRLLPFMFASVKVESDPTDLAIVVPLTALFTENESEWVYVNIGNYHYQKRLVKTGLRLKEKVVIHEGLKPGERLVTDGALLLRAEQETEQLKEETRNDY
ncbi:efflux RND transporter periplasmic adaptor subunit [Nitrosomonas sp. Is37]|uniref:efflux RND transporter periplasmic adaptor subunit n=1 Tax=Nitrosomonas sp. Is37 TaxID=3080535 RepID=UPI00294ADC37|nr:efflux RND transporter periplasmic adaptor subunit [Nitrosomonas sp. Is37]MDV6345320.1 efflux RND transporter periplasmic adaptor subunit [Nitrosomonas sp. Is37]